MNNILSTSVATSFINYMISDCKLDVNTSSNSSVTTGIYNDEFAKINFLRSKVDFKNDSVFNFMIERTDLVRFLNESFEILANNGHYFTGYLDIYNDGIVDKLLFVYHPFLNYKSTKISLENEDEINSKNSTHKEILLKLFKHPLATRKEVVVDEQAW